MIIIMTYKQTVNNCDPEGTLRYENAFPGGASGKEPTSQCRRPKRHKFDLSCKDPLEKEMATHSNILAWRIPWTEEPGGL